MLKISAIPACIENYIWLFHSEDSNHAWVLDPGDANLVIAWLEKNHKELAGILITHHHWDHTDGIEEILSRYSNNGNIPVFGPGKSPLPHTNNPLSEGDQVDIGWLKFIVMEVPGHTKNHIVYLAEPEGKPPLLFSGDTLFSAGCGRLKDGTAEQLYSSLQRLMQLPENTQVYCGHEYTLANLAFALSVEPDNIQALEHRHRCQQKVQQGEMTLPSSIGLEKQINPFVRTDNRAIQQSCEKHLGISPKTPVDCFAALRKWKDNFV